VIAGAVVLGVLVGGRNRDDGVIVGEHSPPAVPRSESGPIFGVQLS
jgi:hypothetical protein